LKFNLPAAAAIAALHFMSAAVAGQSEDESRPAAVMAMAELRGAVVEPQNRTEPGLAAARAAETETREPERHVRIVGPLFFPDH